MDVNALDCQWYPQTQCHWVCNMDLNALDCQWYPVCYMDVNALDCHVTSPTVLDPVVMVRYLGVRSGGVCCEDFVFLFFLEDF